MRKLVLFIPLILLFGTVFSLTGPGIGFIESPGGSFGNVAGGVDGTISGGLGGSEGLGGSGGSEPVNSILYSGLPLNLSENSELIKDELTELGHTDGVSCIESGNVFEISCNDSAGDGTYYLCNNTVVESFGEYNALLTSYNIASNSCYNNNVCYLEIEGVNNPPKSIGSSSDCSDYTYSKDLWDYLDGLNKGIGNSRLKYTRSVVNNWYELGDGICEWNRTTADYNLNRIFDENWLDKKFDDWTSTDSNSPKKTKSEFLDLTFEQKCNYAASMGQKLNVQGVGNLDFDQSSVTFKKFDDIQEYELLDCTSTNSYEIVTECHESPIKPVIEVYLEDNPNKKFDENTWPTNKNIVIDASKTTPADATFSFSGYSGLVSNSPNQKTIIVSSGSESEHEIILNIESNGIQRSVTIPLNFESIIDQKIETSLSSNSVEAQQIFTIRLIAESFDGVDLTEVEFDAGQRENSYGKIVVAGGTSFQCKISSTASCSGDNILVEGLMQNGGSCGCKNLNNAIYEGQLSFTNSTTGFKSYFDGPKLDFSFPISYPSKEACGINRVCELEFKITDSNGKSNTKYLNLNLPAQQTCQGVYENSVPGTNISKLVGYIEEGTQSCECKYGYKPKLNDELSLLLGSETKTCEIIPVKDTTNKTKSNIPTTPYQGYSNPTYNNQLSRPYSDSQNNDIFSNESEEKGYGFLIFGLFIILGAGTIGGFEFYEKKKTGSFVNPLNNIKSLIKKKDNSVIEDKSDYKVSPIQKFITDARKAGETNDTIRQNLINSGWPEEEINKYL